LRLYTPDDTVVSIPHIKIWNTNIFNANDGNRNLCVVAHFYLDPDHDAARARQKLHDVALTSPYLDLNHPIRVIVQEQPWGTHYQLKAYPLDTSPNLLDLTVRGKDALTKIISKPRFASRLRKIIPAGLLSIARRCPVLTVLIKMQQL
jgi:small-conductance mechanosensitive channel